MQVPPNTLLSPADDAAVVGGNVLTSQRVTDVILVAFKAMACSYGCMNNFTFGDGGMGYYETIAGALHAAAAACAAAIWQSCRGLNSQGRRR